MKSNRIKKKFLLFILQFSNVLFQLANQTYQQLHFVSGNPTQNFTTRRTDHAVHLPDNGIGSFSQLDTLRTPVVGAGVASNQPLFF
ncbi:hypothetical protein D3C81_1861020 [compost metagenome]